MNIFILDTDPIIAAQHNCDTHVCKIILEATQMLALTHQHFGLQFKNDAPQKLQEGLYLPRGVGNHPVSRWVRQTSGNYEWTANHAMELCIEYTKRYDKIHATQHITNWLKNNNPFKTKEGQTPFIQAMPEEVKSDDPIQAYRNYYLVYKRHLVKYRLGNAPAWYTSSVL